jgi:hypothetical protein
VSHFKFSFSDSKGIVEIYTNVTTLKQSVAGALTRLRNGFLGIVSRLPTEVRDSYLPQKSGSGAHATFCAVATGDTCPRSRDVGELN